MLYQANMQVFGRGKVIRAYCAALTKVPGVRAATPRPDLPTDDSISVGRVLDIQVEIQDRSDFAQVAPIFIGADGAADDLGLSVCTSFRIAN